ncbi:MAG TPA: nucleotidyl transferase AbiEii/AbiGii toxin family protein [Desulfomonilia bacterium]|nr:nucleotidyl transferase AbiEii/AbiGii toxin family protein [Desulfomonilia bacterium]
MFEIILARLAKALEKRNVPYMIIGGQAVLLYGEPRLTRDIDITLGVDNSHVDIILSLLQELYLKPLPEDIPAFVQKTNVLPAVDEESGIRVDFIFSYTPYESQAIKRAIKVDIRNQGVMYASAEDLIIHKIFSGRPRDLEDVESVIRKHPGIDTPYIREWLSRFDDMSKEYAFLATFQRLISKK